MRSVSVEVHTLDGAVYTFADTSDYPNAGSTALTQLGADAMIHSFGTSESFEGTKEVYIPFHAIEYAQVVYSDSLPTRTDSMCIDTVE